ncbi:DUF559 domain-containing protein [Microbacterium sp. H1-D42]|uniref:endonuclease domain-containing protein n=1 Tax=Microbacterium sp. H1-D42 TaxID=2925844 RepID=UPI001F531CA3|nr:DUF559 domain-containing protein [Microbacterium sp. H1-D42]UNK69558.1 endonuclease domain-containing protein [Microbacterium sp. H1-D42]
MRLQFVALDELHRVRWHSTAATGVLAEVGELSDAGTETRFAQIMRSRGVQIRQQARLDGHRVDALIGERLVVQIDGYQFQSSAKDRRPDIRGDARLVLQRYTVLRFDYQQIMHDPDYVRETVLRAIAQGLHRAGRRCAHAEAASESRADLPRSGHRPRIRRISQTKTCCRAIGLILATSTAREAAALTLPALITGQGRSR